MPEEPLKPIVPTKHKTPKAVAKALLKLYRDPRRHAQHAYLRGRSGRSVCQKSSAVSCCMIGGIGLFMHPRPDADQEAVLAAFDAAAKKLFNPKRDIVYVNDNLGLEAVRKVLQEVIKGS